MQGFTCWADYLLASVDKIRKRLGGERHQQLRLTMENAINAHREKQDTQLHRKWIQTLLTEYYDPMYDYQLSRKMDRVEFRGTQSELRHYLNETIGLR
jgi:tRNA 2-selenouridine synthase